MPRQYGKEQNDIMTHRRHPAAIHVTKNDIIFIRPFFAFCYNEEGRGPPMKPAPREPPIPAEMHDTVRREIIAVLEQGERSAREVSSEVGISEKEVYSHLEHIRKTMSATGRHLAVTPAECRKCGFVFSKRERLKKPGKCPVCRGESIHEPLFSISQN